MKKIFILSIIIYSFSLTAQTYKTVKLIETTKVLHSGGNLFGGVTRVALPINLPRNTVEWYYSFSTTAGSSGSANLNLAIQVAAYASTGPLGSTIAKGLKVPPGTGEVDVWFMNPQYKSYFDSKIDNQVQYYSDLSEISTTQSIKTITNPLQGSFYLGLRNPSVYEAVSITIEVVALVKEEETINGWTSIDKQDGYNTFNKLLKNSYSGQISETDIDNLTGCLMTKITTNYTPQQLRAYAEYELKDILTKFAKKCAEELNINTENVVAAQQNINKDYLIGKWKDQNSTFTLNKNGLVTIVFDSGNILIGNWKIVENKLDFIFNFGNTIYNYIVIEVKEKTLKFKDIKDSTIWTANKIGDY